MASTLASVLGSEASFDAKQLACRELVLLAGPEQVPSLLPLLSDDRLASYALMVLSKLPEPSVSTALLKELPGLKGRALAGAFDLLGERRATAALPSLTGGLSAQDPAVADAAAAGLAKLGGPKATAALTAAFAKAPAARKAPLGLALLLRAQRDLSANDKASALSIARLLDQRTTEPRLRAAALPILVRALGEKSLPRLLQALREDGTPAQWTAAGQLRQVPGRPATLAMCSWLPSLPAGTQALVISALADRGDSAAAPALLALRKASPAVRVAALRALGRLGDATCVSPLLAAALSGTSQENAAARDSLLSLRGARVDAALMVALRDGPPAQQALAVQFLSDRRAPGLVPTLMSKAHSAQFVVSSAALRALREQGGPEQLPGLLGLLVARPTDRRDEVSAAIAEIARRGSTQAQRTDALLKALSSAARPADKADILGILGEVGGPQALKALRGSLASPDATLRTAALRRLAEWPTDEPLSDLLAAVQSGAPSQRVIALRGALRLAGEGQRLPSQTLALYQDLLSKTQGPEEKRLVLSGLSKLNTLQALRYASEFLSDDSVKAEARLCVLSLAHATAAPWREETKALVRPLADQTDDSAAAQQAKAILALADGMGDFITSWEASPAYTRPNTGYAELLDVPFAPESEKGDPVAWRPVPTSTVEGQPWLADLLALYGGEQKVAYLRTAVWSDTERDLQLLLGSDDGAKVWWNGGQVLSVNTQRAVAPGQEKAVVHAAKGWNRLLVKVTQNVMGWGACAQLRNPDGTPATGLRCAVPSDVETLASAGTNQ
jgi:HEAT repeat protein